MIIRNRFGLKHLFWALAIITLGSFLFLRLNQVHHPPQPFLAAGMTPQINLIRELASTNGWRVSCEGRSGRMTVVRLEPGYLPWRASQQNLWNDLAPISSSLRSEGSNESENNCGWATDSFQPAAAKGEFTLGVGPRETMEPLLDVAKSCEVVGATLTDGPPAHQAVFDGEVPDDWVGLVIDGDQNKEAGPLSCFAIIGNRVFEAEGLQD